MAGVRDWGPGDLAGTWEAGTGSEVIYKDLVFTEISVDPWVLFGPLWSLLVIYQYALIRRLSKGITRVGFELAYTVMEALAPMVSRGVILNQADADARFLDDVKAWIDRYPTPAGYTQALFNRYLTAGFPIEEGGAQPYGTLRLGTAATVTDAEHAMVYLCIYAQIRFAQTARGVMAKILVTFLVAVAKIGNATAGFLDKIMNGFQTDAGFDLVGGLIDEEIREVWAAMSPYINDTNVGAAIARWLGFIPAEAIRLRLTLNQIPGEGLTAMTTIKKAMNAFPAFPWAVLLDILPTEAGNLSAGVALVGTNVYYGYRHDLGAAKSTGYKSIAWVAKELLIRKGGDSSLRKYKGWTRTPAESHTLHQMVDDFVNAPIAHNVIAQSPVAIARATALQASFAAATGIVA